MERPILYFDDVGKENTDAIVKVAAERAEELGIKYIVLSSTEGYTALKMAEAVKGKDVKIVAISHQYGLREDGKWEMNEDNMKKLQEMGVVVTTQSHMFSGVERAIQKRLGGASRTDVISDTLRAVFGKGFKVALEVVMMAADSGHIPVSQDTEIIAIGGTRQGADVALVVRPAHSQNFFNMQVREILAMPRAKEEPK
ncbi:pyruvate kinase alpha/beta domain-containing protein [Methanococcoides cohabitans]|uniref:Pyruvate kinase alpha/beta domain-containing protein n=1 Tax=Methanococcoides cohabitans TaxID=3136559 RepID=A0ABU9KPA9_9EURY